MEASESPSRKTARPRSRKSIAHTPSANAVSDKENLTVDSAGLTSLLPNSRVKKSRSKSIGPGGIDALHDDPGNKRKSPIAPQYKSILKPSIPFSPPKAIPPRTPKHSSSPANRRKSPIPQKAREGLLIDISAPENAFPEPSYPSLPNPFGEFSIPTASGVQIQTSNLDHGRVAVRTEEEQQASAKQREQQELLARKDARRKSLANRRVSFAPEATLHTWDVVEMPEDSTTSSASTNATRRASSLTATAVSPYPKMQSPVPSSDALEPPSTPPQQVEEIQVTASPAHQRDLHQKKRRRSSGIPPMNFNNPDDFSSSPNSVGSVSSGDSNHTFMTAGENGESSDSDDKDLIEDETITGIDGEDATARSIVSSSTGSSGRLEEALRQAARQAGTQGIDYDENGDITMEMANEEITAAFKPWMRKGEESVMKVVQSSAALDQENVNPFSPAFKAKVGGSTEDDRDETMECTQAIGTIIPPARNTFPVPEGSSPKSRPSEQGKSGMIRRRSSGVSSTSSNETMDLTVAIGGIRNDQRHAFPQMSHASNADEGDADMSMDFTTAVGGVLNGMSPQDHHEWAPLQSNGRNTGIAAAEGLFLQSITEHTEPAEEDTVGMDITTAIGAILPEQLKTSSTAQAKDLMELETDNGQLSGLSLSREPKNTPEPNHPPAERFLENVRTVASETGSPSLITMENRVNKKKKVGRNASMTPDKSSRHSTPVAKPTTPSKQLTPGLTKPFTPGKTPPLKNISLRTGSPKKLFEAEIKQAAPSPEAKASDLSFRQDSTAAGILTPSVVLKPHSRRSSGLGIDRPGIGSPRVTELLDNRGSIAEDAKPFVAHPLPQPTVRFADPYIMEQEIDQERLDEQHREDGRELLQKEADDQVLEPKDITMSLKDRIESLTPQKKRNKLNGRKSLHVGAAKGLLGKRPAELDDEEDEDSTPKGLRGTQDSPVKKVKLPAPPSKSTTTGRITRSSRVSLAETDPNARWSTPTRDLSPGKASRTTTPKGQPRFKDAGFEASPGKAGFATLTVEDVEEPASNGPFEGEKPMHLQDFLNLTSIRFMELTTTKRRHTMAPSGLLNVNGEKALKTGAENAEPSGTGSELESCVIAGACTLPMLDLYQHSCRELKKYIAEGRSIVREIEDESFLENPPLFREYTTAPPSTKSIMDNQFKNVKTHARLLSKAMWYEWRMKLLDGLKEGLLKNDEGMQEDDAVVTHQEQLIQPVLPEMLVLRDRLEAETRHLQAQADELADCDQNELKEARDSLLSIEAEVVAKRRMIEELQTQSKEVSSMIEDASERRQECEAEIKEAEKVRTNCQGWESSKIQTLQANVAALEQKYGWVITSAADSALTMTYKSNLQLYFTPHCFQSDKLRLGTDIVQTNAPISLAYIADTRDDHPQPLTTEKRFFLQILRAQLQFLNQSKVKVTELLNFVSSGWEKACYVAEEIRILGTQNITEPTILSDEILAVRSLIILKEMQTKIGVALEVGVRTGAGASGIDIIVKPSADVVYGEELNVKKMVDFLEQKACGKRKEKDSHVGQWAQAVKDLEQRLVARGKK